MPRIIAGTLKGRRLLVPRGATTRPTADQIRTALMDALGPVLAEARLLDLFAGAGGVGLEALSRGAAHATFVEEDARATAALRDNIAGLGLEGQTRILHADVLRALTRLERDGERFDIVFLDPPYETGLVATTLASLGDGRLLATPGIVVAQHLSKRPPAAVIGRLAAYRSRRFGETTLTFFRAGAYDASSPAPPTED